MKIFNRLTDKAKFLAKVTLFLYLVFSFYEWSFNPGHWDTLSRIGLILVFGWISNQD
jgi:hypothetical protein